MSDNRQIGKSVLWNTVGSVYYSMCQWLMTVLIVYMTSDYTVIGTLGLAMTVTNSFTAMSLFGIRNYQISDTEHKYSSETYILSRRITASLALVLCAVYFFFIKDSWEEWFCIVVYMLLRLIESVEDVYHGVLQTNWRFDVIGKSYIARGTATVAAFAVVFYCTKKLLPTFLIMVACNAAILFFYEIRATRRIAGLKKIVRDRRVWILLRTCLGIVVFNFCFNSLATVVRVQIKKILGTDVLGVYTTIAAPTVIVQLLVSVIFSPFIPAFAAACHEKRKKDFNRYLRIVLLCFVAVFFFVTVAGKLLGHWGLRLLYGEEIAGNKDLLLPLLWVTVFYAFAYLFSAILISMRALLPLSVGSVAAYVLNALVCGPLISSYGANGGSYSLVLTEGLLGVYLFVMILLKTHSIFRQNPGI